MKLLREWNDLVTRASRLALRCSVGLSLEQQRMLRDEFTLLQQATRHARLRFEEHIREHGC